MQVVGVMENVATVSVFFFFNDTATTEIYTLSLHDALPILQGGDLAGDLEGTVAALGLLHTTFSNGDDAILVPNRTVLNVDRKSTRLNSSHANISYAVFCLKKKNKPLTLPSLLLPLIDFFHF